MLQSDSTRRVPTVDPITILVTQKLVALEGSYNCVIVQFIVYNLIHITSQYTYHSSQVQFVTYSQFESPFHNLNITIYRKMLPTTWGVKPLKQFSTIIFKSTNQNHRSKTWKHEEHSILSTNSHQDINWYVKHNNIIFIIVKENCNSINIPK